MKILPLSLDTVFKKAFGHPVVFTAFVEAVLGIRLKIERVETDKRYSRIKIGQIVPRFDLYAEDREQRIVVEMQATYVEDHFDRFLYYHCLTILEQARHAKNYTAAQTVYTIVLLTHPNRNLPDLGIIDFDPHTPEGQPFGKLKHKLLFVYPYDIPSQRPDAYRAWMELIVDSLDEEIAAQTYREPGMDVVLQQAQYDALSPEELTKMKDDFNQQQLLVANFAEGVAKGKAEGKAEGLAEGKAEGLAEGEMLAKQQLARQLLASGVAMSQIMQWTGLSERAVKALQV